MCGLLRKYPSLLFDSDHRVEIQVQANKGGNGHGFSEAWSRSLKDEEEDFLREQLAERSIQLARRFVDKIRSWTYASRNVVAEARAILEELTGLVWYNEEEVEEIRRNAYEDGKEDGYIEAVGGDSGHSLSPDGVAPKAVSFDDITIEAKNVTEDGEAIA